MINSSTTISKSETYIPCLAMSLSELNFSKMQRRCALMGDQTTKAQEFLHYRRVKNSNPWKTKHKHQSSCNRNSSNRKLLMLLLLVFDFRHLGLHVLEDDVLRVFSSRFPLSPSDTTGSFNSKIVHSAWLLHLTHHPRHLVDWSIC